VALTLPDQNVIAIHVQDAVKSTLERRTKTPSSLFPRREGKSKTGACAKTRQSETSEQSASGARKNQRKSGARAKDDGRAAGAPCRTAAGCQSAIARDLHSRRRRLPAQ